MTGDISGHFTALAVQKLKKTRSALTEACPRSGTFPVSLQQGGLAAGFQGTPGPFKIRELSSRPSSVISWLWSLWASVLAFCISFPGLL